MNKKQTTPDLSNILGGLMKNMSQINANWWQTLHFPQAIGDPTHALINFARSALFFQALNLKTTVYDITDFASYKVNENESPAVAQKLQRDNIKANLVEKFKKIDGNLIYASKNTGIETLFFSWELAAVQIQCFNTVNFTFSVISTKLELANKILNLLQDSYTLEVGAKISD